MSYGHRLNLEEIFFELAESKFLEATQKQGVVRNRDASTGKNTSFDGYPSVHALAAASIAVVGWATSLEAFTNMAWNAHIAPTIPAGTIREMAIKNLSTVEKLKELFVSFSFDLGKANWWATIGQLFRIRNKLVHFREERSYQGFSFADPTRLVLSAQAVADMRFSAIQCINQLGKLSGLSTKFTNGDYEFESVW